MWASRFHARSPAAVGLLIRFLFIGSRLCSTLLSDPASRRSPCASLSLLLHQDGKRTFTSQLLNMLGTQEKRLPAATEGVCNQELVWLRGVDLNHRPLGYEPNELPDCSTPQIDDNVCTTSGQTRVLITIVGTA